MGLSCDHCIAPAPRCSGSGGPQKQTETRYSPELHDAARRPENSSTGIPPRRASMLWWRPALIILIIAIAAGGLPADGVAGEASGEPRITTQGFSIDTALTAEARRFDAIRVRVEAPSRIAKLVISTDEHEIDLANTQDRSVFALVGLDQRPLNAYDVTLDVAPFMNKHFTTPATYRLAVIVEDRGGAMATAALTATVVSEERSAVDATDTETVPQQLRESEMTLTRVATADVAPAEESPLTWITREPIDVTIRLRPVDADAEIRQLDLETWNRTWTRDDIARRISASRPVPYVDVPAARNAAADTILAISDDSGDALLRITTSATHLSQLGTTVTLAVLMRD